MKHAIIWLALLGIAITAGVYGSDAVPPAPPKPLNDVERSIALESMVTQQILVVGYSPRVANNPVLYVVFVATDGKADIETMDGVLRDHSLFLLYQRLHALGREQMALVNVGCKPAICT